MKLEKKYFDKHGKGNVRLVPEEPEDMWHVYNLLNVNDVLESSTLRKVVMESNTGSVESQRVRTTLEIRVESIDFDVQGCMLRVKGRNIRENDYVKLGAYHTLDLELNRSFKLSKDVWDSLHLERLQLACDPNKTADVAAVVMQEGLAHVCLITRSMTLLRVKIEVNIPRKRKGFTTQHDKAMDKFHDMIIKALKTHINFDVVKCVIIAGPGFVAEDLMKYIEKVAPMQENRLIQDNKSKFVKAHASSGFMDSLREALQDPTVQAKLSDTKALGEVKALAQFYDMMKADPSKAFYGIKHVQQAAESQAVDVLLLSDKLYRCNDVNDRKRFVKLVEEVRDAGGDVKIFSSLHISGQQLEMLGGIAAILRFPMPDLEEEAVDSDSD